MSDIDNLLACCKGRPVYIQAHNFPDPDALASGYGLLKFLEKMGISSVFLYDGKLDIRACKKMTENFHIQAVHCSQIKKLEDNAFLICVDSQKGAGNLTGFNVEIAACIDHHPTFVPAEYEYKDVRRAGSCSAIIADYFYQYQIVPDEDTAGALLYGMKIDTLQFSRGVTDLDIEMFGYLKQFCDDAQVDKMSKNTMVFADLKAYASAIESIRVYGTTGIAAIDIPCSNDLIAMISDFFLSLDEIDLSIVYCFREDGVKFSVRSEIPMVHAGNWVRKALEGLGTGGGHAYMGGGVIEPENISKLGIYPDETIRDLFLKARDLIERLE